MSFLSIQSTNNKFRVRFSRSSEQKRKKFNYQGKSTTFLRRHGKSATTNAKVNFIYCARKRWRLRRRFSSGRQMPLHHSELIRLHGRSNVESNRFFMSSAEFYGSTNEMGKQAVAHSGTRGIEIVCCCECKKCKMGKFFGRTSDYHMERIASKSTIETIRSVHVVSFSPAWVSCMRSIRFICCYLICWKWANYAIFLCAAFVAADGFCALFPSRRRHSTDNYT